ERRHEEAAADPERGRHEADAEPQPEQNGHAQAPLVIEEGEPETPPRALERHDPRAVRNAGGQPASRGGFPRPRAKAIREAPLRVALPQIPGRDLPDEVGAEPEQRDTDPRLERHGIAQIRHPDERPGLRPQERPETRPEREVEVPLSSPAKA